MEEVINNFSRRDIINRMLKTVEKINNRNFIIYTIKFLPHIELIKPFLNKVKKQCLQEEKILQQLKIEVYNLCKMAKNEFTNYCNYVIGEIDSMRTKVEEEIMELEDELDILQEEARKNVNKIKEKEQSTGMIVLLKKDIEMRMKKLQQKLKETENNSILRLKAIEDDVALSISELEIKVEQQIKQGKDRIRRIEEHLTILRNTVCRIEELLKFFYGILNLQIKLLYFAAIAIACCCLIFIF